MTIAAGSHLPLEDMGWSSTPELSEAYTQFARPGVGRLLHTFRLDKAYYRARGDRLYYRDEGGREREVIDFLGGFGASLFGHHHPTLVRAARRALDAEWPMNAQASCRIGAARLAQKLDALLFSRTGAHYVSTLVNTGAEAVEAALKHAELRRVRRIEMILRDLERRSVWIRQALRDGSLVPAPDFMRAAARLVDSSEAATPDAVIACLSSQVAETFRVAPVVLALERSFHGKTTGAVQLTFAENYRKPFAYLGPLVVFIPPEDDSAIERAVAALTLSYPWLEVEKDRLHIVEREHTNVSAMFVEPLQGEGGIHVISKHFLERCRAVATRCEFPLVFDEIQSGMGRTGTLFFSEQRGVIPDYYLVGKSFGGGLAKIAALLVEQTQYVRDFDVLHTSTFAEDDPSAGVALAALGLLEEDPSILLCCRERGNAIRERLMALQDEYPDVIREIRGAGLMLGVSLAPQLDSASPIIRALWENGGLGPALAGYLLHEHGIRLGWTLSDSDTLRIEPSAFISLSDCDALATGFRRMAEILHKSNSYALTRFLVRGETSGAEEPVFDHGRAPLLPPTADAPARSVAFIGHLIRAADLLDFDPTLAGYEDEELSRLIDRLYEATDGIVAQRVCVRSLTAERVEFILVALLFDANVIVRELSGGHTQRLLKKVEQAVEVAIELGCSVVGLGGYTSIITHSCRDIVTDAITVTSGNAFTVGMGVEALRQAARERGIDTSTATLAAVGAAGNICATYVEILAGEIPRLILIGRPGSETRIEEVAQGVYAQAYAAIRAVPESNATLGGVAGRIRNTHAVRALLADDVSPNAAGRRLLVALARELGPDAPIEICTDPERVRDANLIVSASSQPAPILFPRMLAEGPIAICDIAVPGDVADSIAEQRPDVTVIQGGVVKLPLASDFRIRGIPLEKGNAFACMSETMLLGLTGCTGHYSFGRISKAQVEEISEIARRHGFGLARPKVEPSY